MAKVRIKQVRSLIGRPRYQRDTMVSLGLGKMNRVVEKEANPSIMGMVKTVSHLVQYEVIG